MIGRQPSSATAAAALMDDESRYSAALYCTVCPLKTTCGGLHCKASPMSCDEFCCGQEVGCTTVCPKHPDYLQQFAEVGGFDLDRLPHIPGPAVSIEDKVVPLIYHGSKRHERFRNSSIAVRFSDLIDFRARSPRFLTRADVCEEFKVDDTCDILISGVDHDPSIERIWALDGDRTRIFVAIASLGIACATTPNFSMVLDVPRADNLHAMQRIAILYNEMSRAGLPTALHVNGRTDHDFVRWSKFLRDRPHINAIAYEFITGSGLSARLAKHVGWLNQLSEHVGRPLVCIVRGNPDCLDLLGPGYRPVYIETTSFIKTVKRQVPVRCGNTRLRWNTERTGSGEEVSEILQHNFREVQSALVSRYPSLASPFRA